MAPEAIEPEPPGAIWRNRSTGSISPLEGEMPGRAEGGVAAGAESGGYPPLSLRDISPSRGEIRPRGDLPFPTDPLCLRSGCGSAGILPTRLRSWRPKRSNESNRGQSGTTGRRGRSPPLRGRCPAGQRGVVPQAPRVEVPPSLSLRDISPLKGGEIGQRPAVLSRPVSTSPSPCRVPAPCGRPGLPAARGCRVC